MKQGPHGKQRIRGRSNGRRPPNPRNQSFDSNGPDVKVRGNAQQVVDKYLALARDASSSGDRIAAESYYQHAEHYFRLLNAAAPPRRMGGLPGPQAGPQPALPGDVNGEQPDLPVRSDQGRDPAREPQPQVLVVDGDPPAGRQDDDESAATA